MAKRISRICSVVICSPILLIVVSGLLQNAVLADKAEDAAKQAKELVKKANEAVKAATDAKKAADEAAKKAGSEKSPEDQKAEEAAKAADDAAKAADDASDEAEKKQLEADAAAAAAKKAGGGTGEKSAEQIAADKAKEEAKDAEKDLADAEKESAEADKKAEDADKKIENRDVKKKKADARVERRKARAARRSARKKLREAKRLLEERKRREGTSPTKGSKELEKELEELGKSLGAPQKDPPNQRTVGTTSSTASKSLASSTAAVKTTVFHTDDWQPGDEVSFSFSGTVFSPAEVGNPGDDYTGYVVGIVDSNGKKTEMPWSKLVRYTVPAGIRSVVATLTRPDGSVRSVSNIPIHTPGYIRQVNIEARIVEVGASPLHQIGQPWVIHSPGGAFSSPAGIILEAANKSGNWSSTSNVVASSPRIVMFKPAVTEPGDYRYTLVRNGIRAHTFDISVIGLKLDTSRVYRTNQGGVLAVAVVMPQDSESRKKLLDNNFRVSIEMNTPTIMNFAGGNTHEIWTLSLQDVANQQAVMEFPVRAGAPGTFNITARARTPTIVGPMTYSRPPIFYKPGDPEQDPCAKQREELDRLKKQLADKEKEAAGLPDTRSEAAKAVEAAKAGLDAARKARKTADDDLAKKASRKDQIERNVGKGKTFPDKDAAKKNFGDYEKAYEDAKNAKDEADKRVTESEKKQQDSSKKSEEVAEKEKTLPQDMEELKKKIGEAEQALRDCEEAEKKKKDEAAEKDRLDKDKARDTEAAREAERARTEAEKARIQYLLGNIKTLGLINSSSFWDSKPDENEDLIRVLELPLETAAEDVAKVPVPLKTFDALKGIYGLVGAMLDPCTGLGYSKTVQRVQGLTFLGSKPPRNYTPDEAMDKTDGMCDVLKKLKVLASKAGK